MNPKELIELRKKRGAVLQLARRKLKISKSTHSKKTGLSRDTIDRMESGKSGWLIDTEIIYLNGLNTK